MLLNMSKFGFPDSDDVIDIIRKHTANMVLVPAEPTEERVRVLMRGWDSIGSHTMYENYRDMVALGEGK